MSTIVKLVQGSVEWHEHRRSDRNASETAAVLGCSKGTVFVHLSQGRRRLRALLEDSDG